jgi:hypothetical protein
VWVNPGEIDRLLAEVDRACAAVIANPGDRDARAALAALLMPMADPDFADGAGHGSLRYGLLRQAAGIATVVRHRIEEANRGRYGDSFAAMHIGSAARDFKRVIEEIAPKRSEKGRGCTHG